MSPTLTPLKARPLSNDNDAPRAGPRSHGTVAFIKTTRKDKQFRKLMIRVFGYVKRYKMFRLHLAF